MSRPRNFRPPAALALFAAAALLAGCAAPAAFYPGEGGSLERYAVGEKTIERYAPDGYALTQESKAGRLKLYHQSGPSDRHRAEARQFLTEIDGLAGRIEKLLRRSGRATEEVVLLPTTFANLDDLTKTSTFGRLAAEQLAVSLTARRFEVIELRRSVDLLIQPRSGELALTRESEELNQAYQANALLVGTYAVTAQHVVLTVRLIRAGDNHLAAAGTSVFDRSGNLFLNSLLLNESRPVGVKRDRAQTGQLVKVGVATRYFEPSAVKEEDIKPQAAPAKGETAKPQQERTK